MTRACCPECGYDLNLGTLREGDQRTATCENCTSELLITVNEGEIRAQNLMEYDYPNSDGSELDRDVDY